MYKIFNLYTWLRSENLENNKKYDNYLLYIKLMYDDDDDDDENYG